MDIHATNNGKVHEENNRNNRSSKTIPGILKNCISRSTGEILNTVAVSDIADIPCDMLQ